MRSIFTLKGVRVVSSDLNKVNGHLSGEVVNYDQKNSSQSSAQNSPPISLRNCVTNIKAAKSSEIAA